MDKRMKRKNRIMLFTEIILTVAICFGIAFSSYKELSIQASNFSKEVMADYSSLTDSYIRDFQVLRMEAEEQIKKDLTFDEMLAWLQSREEDYQKALGEGIYDGFAFTYKGGYVHSWAYGDYSEYVPASRPWYQVAEKANGEIGIVAPYLTYLSDTDLIAQYDSLRMSIVQKYNDEISFDYDLDVKEINELLAERSTMYQGTVGFLYDDDGYILSSTDAGYYGHNIEVDDEKISKRLSKTLSKRNSGKYGELVRNVEGQLRMSYSYTDGEGLTLTILVPFWEVFYNNFMFVLLLACLLIGIEIYFYKRNEDHLEVLERGKEKLNEALTRAEEASHAKGDFMSRMSHEIRTPLNAVIGYMTIAQMKDSDQEKVQHCLENSELAAKHLLSIINDVLDMSAIESGKIKIANTDFNLKQQISTIATIFYNQAKNHDLDFEVHMNGFTEEWVVGDQLRVNQILMNLLSNAVKFTPEKGSVILDVFQLEKNDKQVMLQFKVRDTGIGMSEEYLARMFKPFEQESAGTAQKYGGTGLGLSISKNLTSLMNGTIEVESKLNEGTTFTVTLPFGVSEENAMQKKDKKDFSKVRVLIVDDQEADQSYAKEILHRLGVKSDTVSDGPSAVKRFIGRLNTDYAYDMCIIDFMMPECDGIEVAKEIRAAGGEGIPIIIATAYDVTEIDREAKAAGVDRVIAKPLFQSTLFDLLVSTFGKYEVQGEEILENAFDLKGIRILLAEDNAMNSEIAVSILTKAGIIVETAENGKEALDKFEISEENYYTAILMDVQMPIMNGYEATRAIRKSSHPQAQDIPIIAMTANAFSEDIAEALANGMNAHISKPVNYDKLFEALKKYTHKEN